MKRCFVLFLSLLLIGCQAAPAPDVFAAPSPSPVPFCVVLDCGHGGFDGGAVGVDTGVVEADLNLSIGLLVRDALKRRGVSVRLTRADGNALGETKRADMQARGAILESPDADCTVSIHMNKFSDRSVAGPMAFYQAGAEAGQRLAAAVIDKLCDALGKPRRLPNPADNFVTRVPTAPSVLVECGFLSNAADERNLQDPDYQVLLAEAIADGVLAFLCAQTENLSDGTSLLPADVVK
ncbi:MAG: N-acetylmuramoyl-L-alanine amidase [Clostridia bacterium]|nr:N-acetylmuramoyl-L-alanine amidase [Clostridia bacterium]